MSQKIFSLLVRPEEGGSRLDVFLRGRFRRFSRAEIQRKIDRGDVVHGALAKASRRVSPGELVELSCEVPEEEPLTAPTPKTLYEDERLLIVEKPPDLPVHPCGGFGQRSVLTLLQRERQGYLTPSHRLDRETSGVLLFAKDPAADQALKESFRKKLCRKEYLALVEGVLHEDERVIDLAIGPAGGRIRARWGPKAPEEGGFASKTLVKVDRRFPRHTRLKLSPETGRQHQLRVHLQAIGHPLVGDKLYGPSEDLYVEFARERRMTQNLWDALGLERQALHARSLSLPHPDDGRVLTVESPWPEDLRAYEERLDAMGGP